MPRLERDSRILIGALGCAALLFIGWSGLLLPSMIRSIERDLHQDDGGIGLFYFIYALAYASGSLSGGATTERLGRRVVLSAAALIHGAGLAVLGLVPDWTVFLIAAVPAGLGAGAIDGGTNGLFLDLYRSARGRALNTLHLFFSLGALISPLVVGQLLDIAVPWQSIIVATALAFVPLGLAFAVTWPPHGRRESVGDVSPTNRRPLALQWPLVALALAICAYVASEVGVSDWLVRFLASAPLVVATTSLSLFWAGLTLGRLVSARIADRFDHVQFATASIVIASIALAAAVLMPWLPASIALFGVVGFAFGPIFPMIIAIGGEQYPDRSAAVGGFLTGSAVVGAVVYPPVMGFLSVQVGLAAAMLGAALLGLACAGCLVLTRSLITQRREVPVV